MRLAVTRSSCLIVVDVQRDFMPGGALPVPQGDIIIDPLNRLIELFSSKGLSIVFTRDWHPRDHISFSDRGGPWPPHCVMNTSGAEFHPNLRAPHNVVIISKGTERDKEAYSGFQGTNLHDILLEKGIKRLFIGGVATEYCVKSTVLDALEIGFETIVVEEAIKGIRREDEIRAKEEMIDSGAILASINEIKF
ncbi:MAG: nicotinamidase [Thermoproteota archaeon]|jgi:nicotinamidase/pyrazinamidase|uniref:nicotinamidase n=1 Tax=Candidatus Methanodesulfokora washburnensis TaxID=2478471 RepID=A0A429GIA6_9CREN|nr:nicotinamidase [Candidatus Methanodesulfokores washburnensis]RSN73610.1 nicotinamidase [Candidatus Methanodesulfokores washburnensis]RZN58184.1 MAG: nicotinamidase [Candidatus Methanodesulfokores washburnensis]TDA39850.1 MAG: nicotinamidase [Candidatus Korarchaeota archaeon]